MWGWTETAAPPGAGGQRRGSAPAGRDGLPSADPALSCGGCQRAMAGEKRALKRSEGFACPVYILFLFKRLPPPPKNSVLDRSRGQIYSHFERASVPGHFRYSGKEGSKMGVRIPMWAMAVLFQCAVLPATDLTPASRFSLPPSVIGGAGARVREMKAGPGGLWFLVESGDQRPGAVVQTDFSGQVLSVNAIPSDARPLGLAATATGASVLLGTRGGPLLKSFSSNGGSGTTLKLNCCVRWRALFSGGQSCHRLFGWKNRGAQEWASTGVSVLGAEGRSLIGRRRRASGLCGLGNREDPGARPEFRVDPLPGCRSAGDSGGARAGEEQQDKPGTVIVTVGSPPGKPNRGDGCRQQRRGNVSSHLALSQGCRPGRGVPESHRRDHGALAVPYTAGPTRAQDCGVERGRLVSLFHTWECFPI